MTHRYIKVKADGAGTITVIAYNNSGAVGDGASRGVELYSARTADPAGDTYSGKIGETVAVPSKEHATGTFTIPAAGEYYITCNNAMTFAYVQLDQLVSAGEGVEEVKLAGEVVVSKIEVTKPETVTNFKVGATFTHEGYTVKATGVNNVTCVSSVADVTADAEFVAPDMTSIGKKTVTVNYGGVSATYEVIVESAVDGIYGVTASLKSDVDTQVASADGTVALTKNDIVVTLVGTNAEATIDSYTVKVDGGELTDTVNLTAGTHTIEVTAVVKAGSAESTLIDTLDITITVKPTEGSLTNVVADSTAVSPLSGTLTAETELVNNTSGKIFITADATNTVVIESNGKTYGDKSFTHRIKLGGTGTVDYRTIGIEVKQGATIVIYAMASSGSASRDVQLLNADGTVATATATLDGNAMGQVDGAALHKVEYTVSKAGTYYFGSVASGLNVYGVEIIYA